MIQAKELSDSSTPRASNIFLLLIWGVSGVILSLPSISSWPWTEKAIFLFPPVFFTLIATLARPQEGFAFWAFILTFLVSQTGFQAQFGPITTSALELCIVVLLVILLLADRSGKQRLVSLNDLPGYKWYFAFALYSLAIFIFGVLRGHPTSNALIEFKGFLLYPLMIYLMLAGIRSKRLLAGAILFMALWYVFISGRAILDFLNHQDIVYSSYSDVYRASGEYAPVNIFGASAVVVAVLVLGCSASSESAKWRYVLRTIGLILLLGAWTSLSRNVIIALAVGLFVLTLQSGRRGLAVGWAVLVAALLVFYFLPLPLLQSSVERVFQLSDSSTLKRWFYLESGLRALLVYWPIGAGWGKAFWYYPGVGLVPTGSIPWYHNDFLNLAVQVGLPGLLLYIGFWFSVLRTIWQWLRQAANSAEGIPFVVGGSAAISALLAGALFEHLLWRPDMGGLVAWSVGVAVVGMKLTTPGTELVP